MIKEIAFLLITVTGNGVVNHSTFSTKQLCKEARNLVLFGKTIEQMKKDDDEAAAARKKILDAFYKAHPPRPPKTKEELELVQNEKTMRAQGGHGIGVMWGPCSSAICGLSIMDDYQIQDEPGMGLLQYSGALVGGQDVNPNSVKTAECIKTVE